MVRQWQELFYDGRYSHTDLSDNPDFVMVASGYGIKAERVEDAGELRDALGRFLNSREPALLHCACFPAENVWPLIPPGATVEDAMESAPQAEAIVA
jgi:acetolactate synthase-1/2/3 large subunit